MCKIFSFFSGFLSAVMALPGWGQGLLHSPGCQVSPARCCSLYPSYVSGLSAQPCPWAGRFPALISHMAYCHPSQCSQTPQLPAVYLGCLVQMWDCVSDWGDSPAASCLPTLESSNPSAAPDVLSSLSAWTIPAPGHLWGKKLSFMAVS